MYSIEIEQDEGGWHAVIIRTTDNAVVWITNTFNGPDQAEAAARSWIDWNAARSA